MPNNREIQTKITLCIYITHYIILYCTAVNWKIIKYSTLKTHFGRRIRLTEMLYIFLLLWWWCADDALELWFAVFVYRSKTHTRAGATAGNVTRRCSTLQRRHPSISYIIFIQCRYILIYWLWFNTRVCKLFLYYYRTHIQRRYYIYISRVGPNREKTTFGGRARRKTQRYFVSNVLRHIACTNDCNNKNIIIIHFRCAIIVLNPNEHI